MNGIVALALAMVLLAAITIRRGISLASLDAFRQGRRAILLDPLGVLSLAQAHCLHAHIAYAGSPALRWIYAAARILGKDHERLRLWRINAHHTGLRAPSRNSSHS